MSQTKKPVSFADELVEVELFKDNDKYKNDVFVCVNGDHIQVRRGERVKIKRKFAEVLSIAEQQRKAADRTIQTLSKGGLAVQ